MFLDYISAKHEKEMFRVFGLKKREKKVWSIMPKPNSVSFYGVS